MDFHKEISVKILAIVWIKLHRQFRAKARDVISFKSLSLALNYDTWCAFRYSKHRNHAIFGCSWCDQRSADSSFSTRRWYLLKVSRRGYRLSLTASLDVARSANSCTCNKLYSSFIFASQAAIYRENLPGALSGPFGHH